MTTNASNPSAAGSESLLQIGMIGFIIGVSSNLLLILTGFAFRFRTYPWLGGVDFPPIYFLASDMMIHGLTTLGSSLLIGIGFVGHWKINRNPLSVLSSLIFIASTLTTVNWIYYLPDLGYFNNRLWSLNQFESYWPQGTFVLLLAMVIYGLDLVLSGRGQSSQPDYNRIGIGIIGPAILGFIPSTLIAGIYWIPITMIILTPAYLIGLVGLRMSHEPSPKRETQLIVVAFVITGVISILMMLLFF
ncbi:MAG: hypothetical protein ACW98U_07085 [Candidatus Thorarchaeota archaeon]